MPIDVFLPIYGLSLIKRDGTACFGLTIANDKITEQTRKVSLSHPIDLAMLPGDSFSGLFLGVLVSW